MKKLVKPAALALVLLAAGVSPVALAAKAAAAPAAAGSAGINGIGVANLDAVVANSAAFKAAQTQRDAIYKDTLDAAKARQSALEGQLRPLAEKFEKDRAANAPAASLQQQYGAIQQLQEGGKQELEKMLAPVRLADAYVMEQINDKMSAAIQAAMTKNNVTLLLSPQAVQAASNAYNLNQAILAELDATVPSVSVQPPAGWLPREVREQQAAQAQRGTAGSGEGR